LELAISITSLAISLAVAVSQLLQWRHAGPVVRCLLQQEGDGVVVTARNIGRGSCDVSGFGFMFGGLEYPWITEVATRYWPGAGQWTTKQISSPFPYVLRGRAAGSWYVPVAEVNAAYGSFARPSEAIKGYIVLATGETVVSRDQMKAPGS
jgi:hypothetical protein